MNIFEFIVFQMSDFLYSMIVQYDILFFISRREFIAKYKRKDSAILPLLITLENKIVSFFVKKFKYCIS